MSVTILSLDMTSYNYLFLGMLCMGLGLETVVSIFLLRVAFLGDQMLDCCACMRLLNVASEIGVYLVTCFTVNSGQDLGKPFIIALYQVEIVGDNKAPW